MQEERTTFLKVVKTFASIIILAVVVGLVAAAILAEHWIAAVWWGLGAVWVPLLTWSFAIGGAIYQWTGRRVGFRKTFPYVGIE